MLRPLVAIVAILAPALHLLSDVLEWLGGGFSTGQLWLNYIAFLPMPWLLLGIHAVHERKPGSVGLIGALIYGAAFVYFLHTTLFALAEHVPDYAMLWARLGRLYTVHGMLMILGGAMFAWAVWRAGWLPRHAVLLFQAGLLANLVLGLLPVPDILQTLGSAVRNLGLMAMGDAILRAHLRTGRDREIGG